MPTHYPGTKSEIRALNAYITLTRAAESLSAHLIPALARHELTGTQFGVLEVLHHLGPLSQKEIGAKLLKSGGNMTLVIDNLEKRGLATRTRSAEDRRVVHVSLTHRGRELVEATLPDHVAGIVERMAVLSPADQEQLRRLCRAVGLGVG